jgi:hypothetical protein
MMMKITREFAEEVKLGSWRSLAGTFPREKKRS